MGEGSQSGGGLDVEGLLAQFRVGLLAEFRVLIDSALDARMEGLTTQLSDLDRRMQVVEERLEPLGKIDGMMSRIERLERERDRPLMERVAKLDLPDSGDVREVAGAGPHPVVNAMRGQHLVYRRPSPFSSEAD